MSPRIQVQKIFWFASLYQKPGETSFVYTLGLGKKENTKIKNQIFKWENSFFYYPFSYISTKWEHTQLVYTFTKCKRIMCIDGALLDKLISIKESNFSMTKLTSVYKDIYYSSWLNQTEQYSMSWVYIFIFN